jgi:hypothetical protein
MTRYLLSIAALALGLALTSPSTADASWCSQGYHGYYGGYHYRHGHVYYPGRYHYHWGHRYWQSRYGCYTYWCPNTCNYYYWCQPDNCYYSVDYSPYHRYCW